MKALIAKLLWYLLFALILPVKLSYAGILNPYGIINAKHSGKCLGAAGASLVSGANIVQNSCSGLNHEQWQLRPTGDAYQVVVRHSGQCLSVGGGLLTDDANVIQQTCTGVNNQLWYARLKGDYFQLAAKHSGKCLNVNAASKSDGARISQRACLGSDNQSWGIPVLAHTPIYAKHSNLCLNVSGNSTADGAAVAQTGCNGVNSQQWTLMPYQNAYRIVVNHSGKCLTVGSASMNEGAPVVQQSCAGVNHELWLPVISGKHYQLMAKHSNKCLTVNNVSLLPGGTLVQNACMVNNHQLWNISTSSTTGGKWSPVIKLPIVPVAAAALPDGKILLWSGRDRDSAGGERTYTALFNPATGQSSERLVYETGHDMFCPGTSNLADGRILVNGGYTIFATSIYDPVTQAWTRSFDMNIPRGYSGNTVLSNSDVFTLGGSWSGGVDGKDGEVWNVGNGWRRTPGISANLILTDDPVGIYRADNHAWLFGIENGQVFHAGPSKQMNRFNTAGSGSAASAGMRGNDNHSMNGNASWFDIKKILTAGGAPAYENSTATKSSYVVDFNSGAVTAKVASMAYARAYNSSVVLPDGSVLVSGGQGYPVPFTDAQPALAPELWEPGRRAFTTLAPMAIPRTYHSVAILLQDGRVFVGGGGLCGNTCSTNHADAAIFTPPYLLNGDGTNAVRPVITQAPATAAYGANINVVANSPVNKFAAVRLSSITHSVNNDQRRIPLTFSTTAANTYSVKIPASSGIATPGYYMLFALNSAGVPSIAKIIKIG